MSGRRVLIVGGGIAGLALARMLARIGVWPEVIEREPVWRPAGTGMYLPGNATCALRALGLGAQVASRSVEIPRQRFCDERGRLLCEVDVAALRRPLGPCLAMHRADLHALLREAAGDVPIRMGRTADRIAQRDGIVSVECSDGTSGDYDLVVAADGINSAVRELTFEPTAVTHPVGQVGWRFVGSRPPEVTTWSVMLGRRTAFLTVPIGDDRVYCYCDALSPREPGSAERGPAEWLMQLFSEFADPAATLLDTLDAAADIHVSTIEEVVVDSWVRDHVLLIGDAAHATSPNMAQGAAMALEDAIVLAHCLRDIRAIPDALAAFEARRRPRTEWVRAQTHRRDHTRYLPPTVRDNVLRVLGRRIFHAHYRPLLDQP
jgi:2-polyprenyl-6-methoxyphenol hydroxylase-like FAD-dependent oxidoreductase